MQLQPNQGFVGKMNGFLSGKDYYNAYDGKLVYSKGEAITPEDLEMAKQFLTFRLDNNQYAVEVHKVQEVLEYKHITKIPCAANYVEGLISSRDRGISVINLRKKFGLEEIELNKECRIIVLEIALNGSIDENPDDIHIFGAIADSVQEVIEIEDIDIEAAPKFGNNISVNFISGIGKKDGEFIIILNIDSIFSSDEILNLEDLVQNPVLLAQMEQNKQESETAEA